MVGCKTHIQTKATYVQKNSFYLLYRKKSEGNKKGNTFFERFWFVYFNIPVSFGGWRDTNIFFYNVTKNEFEKKL